MHLDYSVNVQPCSPEDRVFQKHRNSLQCFAGITVLRAAPFLEIFQICLLDIEPLTRFWANWPQRKKVIKLAIAPSMMAKNALVWKQNWWEKMVWSNSNVAQERCLFDEGGCFFMKQVCVAQNSFEFNGFSVYTLTKVAWIHLEV